MSEKRRKKLGSAARIGQTLTDTHRPAPGVQGGAISEGRDPTGARSAWPTLCFPRHPPATSSSIHREMHGHYINSRRETRQEAHFSPSR